MAEITAAAVGKLREMTNAGLMDCKRALTEAKGDLHVAVDILRKKGVATAAKKASREAREGIIAQCILPGSRVGVLVEINCETDFVAKNDTFKAFCDEIARKLAMDPKADPEADRVGRAAAVRVHEQPDGVVPLCARLDHGRGRGSDSNDRRRATRAAAAE